MFAHTDKRTAIATSLGSVGIAGVMWGLDKLDIQFPGLVVYTVVVVCAALVLISVFLWCRIIFDEVAWVRNLSRGYRVLSVTIIGGVGLILLAIASALWVSRHQAGIQLHDQLLKESQSKQYIGQILPADEQINLVDIASCAANIPEGSMTVVLGNNIASTQGRSMQIVQMYGEPLLNINLSDDGILVSGKIYNQEGRILVKLDKNEWRVANYAPWYERPDAHTLRVYDERDNEVLSLNYVNSHVVMVTGIFRSPADPHSPLIVEKDKITGPNKSVFKRNCVVNAGVVFSLNTNYMGLGTN